MKINVPFRLKEHLMYSSVTTKGLLQHKSQVQIFAQLYLESVPFELATFFIFFFWEL